MKKFLFKMSLLLGVLFLISPLFAEETSMLSYRLQPRINWMTGKVINSVYLKATNVVKHVPLDLIVKRLGDSVALATKVEIEDEGSVIDIKLKKEFFFICSDCVEGEPLECILSNDDKTVYLSTTVIPRPLEVKDEAGHILSLMLGSLAADLYLIEASGFLPDEEVICCSISGSEIGRFKARASDTGTFTIVINPAIINKTLGQASFEIIGKTTKNLKIKYWWGLGVMEEYRSKDPSFKNANI